MLYFNNTWALSKFKFEFPYSIHFCPFIAARGAKIKKRGSDPLFCFPLKGSVI
jgi:hypothetical protein